MKKELRGKSSKYFILNEAIDIIAFFESVCSDEATEEQIDYCNNQFCIDIKAIKNLEKLKASIRETILSQYNKELSSTYLFMYLFLSWYRDGIKELRKLECQNYEILLDFRETLTIELVNSVRLYLTEEYDKDNLRSVVRHLQIKLLAHMKTIVCNSDDVRNFELIEKNVVSVIKNCKFLMLIDNDWNIDRDFMLRWEYYPIDSMFRDVINTFDSEISQEIFIDLKDNEFRYFNLVKTAKVDFSSIKDIDIIKDGKKRTVHFANKPIDQVTLIYLAKRLNKVFDISYPNRDKIMESCFNLIDSLPRLDDYTIYKFDFEKFFDSVHIKQVYENYLNHSDLYTYEKELILRLAKRYKVCVQGLPTSNALTEIISRDFDNLIRATFAEEGLVFYKRYVDDCILIFNHRVEKEKLDASIEKCRKDTFGKNVSFSKTKSAYQTKYTGDIEFDYLGYLFKRCTANGKNGIYRYFEFGIAERKIEKYKKQLDGIFDYYEKHGNERLLLRRLQYFNSRIVFYNYGGSKYANKCTWDVRGVVNSYRMLRRYVIWEDKNKKEKDPKKIKPNRIEEKTYDFLKYCVRNNRNAISIVPQYLQGKGCEAHTLWEGFLYNKSIVFQPNIGWSNEFLNERLRELGISTAKKSYYEKTRDYYTELIKKL